MTLITAHRGGAGLWPENSLSAFRNAAALAGLDAVELDVQACRDGPLVVFHDPTLERMTDGRGRLVDTPFSVVRQCHLKDTAAEPPPTLDEVLDVVAPTRLELKLEIKRAPGADASDMVARCLAATERHSMTARTLFMSFDCPVLDTLRGQGRVLRFSVLSDWKAESGAAEMEDVVDRAVAQGAAAIGVNNRPPEDAAGQVAARAALFARARGAGLRTAVWTVNGEAELKAWLADDAVDDVTTDRPDRALAVRDAARAVR